MSRHNDMLEEMILAGAAEVAGIDDNGELTYSFTKSMPDLYPELAQTIEAGIYSHFLVLWEKGFVDITMTDDDPVVTLTEKSKDLTELSKLTDHQQLIMKNIVEYFSEE